MPDDKIHELSVEIQSHLLRGGKIDVAAERIANAHLSEAELVALFDDMQTEGYKPKKNNLLLLAEVLRDYLERGGSGLSAEDDARIESKANEFRTQIIECCNNLQKVVDKIKAEGFSEDATNAMLKRQIEIQMGQAELQIRVLISDAKYRYANRALEVKDHPDDETLKQALKVAEEEVMNAYDEACAKYLDAKIDKVRFRKMYETEIRQLVERCTDKYGKTTNFQATSKVYDEWFDREK